jgi:hypothetical protein
MDLLLSVLIPLLQSASANKKLCINHFKQKKEEEAVIGELLGLNFVCN